MRKILLTTTTCFLLLCLHAQPSADSLTYARSINKAVRLFQDTRGDQLPIYTGIYYYGYYNVKGTAFFEDLDFRPGTINYDGREYYQVPMRYEQVRDLLIVQPLHDFRGIVLFSPRVKRFSFDNHNFVYLDSLDYPSLPGNGFYEEIAKGRLTIYSKTTKLLEEHLEGTQLTRIFNQKNFIYAVKDSVFYRITNQSSLMDLIKDRKKEVMDLMKSQKKLKFRKARLEASRLIANYYNQLTR